MVIKTLNDILCISAENLFPKSVAKKKHLPYWNEKVKPIKDKSIFWGHLWNQNGRPTDGCVYNIYKGVKRKYHQAVSQIKKEENQLRRQRMAECISQNRTRDLWTELRRVSPSANQQTNSIDGMATPQEICEAFANKYRTILNSVPSSSVKMSAVKEMTDNLIGYTTTFQECDFKVESFRSACGKLKPKKHDGQQDIWSNMLKNVPNNWLSALVLCFKGMLLHGYYPRDLLLSIITSIPKDLASDMTASDNYRGICLNSGINKIFDYVILAQYAECLKTNPLQFAFKQGMSTNLCTLAVKDVAKYYIDNGGKVYACLLDASKAFDRLRFDALFALLLQRKLPALVIRLLLDSYERQLIQSGWQGHVSRCFSATNGIKQGGVASPVMFTIYMDVLIERLEQAGVGCYVGHEYFGCVCYADDITLMAPTANALQQMLKICEEFSKEYDVSFNSKKTKCICFSKNLVNDVPVVHLQGDVLEWSTHVKHLGNHLAYNLSEQKEIRNKQSDFIRRVNSIIVNYGAVSRNVTNIVYTSQCYAFYGAQTWNLTDRSLEDFATTWRKATRRVWGLPYMTRSFLLPELTLNKDFMGMICGRTIKLCETVKGCKAEKLKFLFLRPHSMLVRNMNFISQRYGCDISMAAVERPTSDEATARADMIKELIMCREGQLHLNGMQEDINELIHFIATFRH